TIINDLTGSGIGQCGAIVVFLDVGTYFIKVVERGSNAIIGTYLLQVAYQTARGAEAEPVGVTGGNDTTATADGSLLGGNDVYVSGDHTNGTDVDVYAITVPPGGRIRAEVIEGDRATESCEMFGIDSRLRLFSETGALLVDDNANRGRGLCSLIDG